MSCQCLSAQHSHKISVCVWGGGAEWGHVHVWGGGACSHTFARPVSNSMIPSAVSSKTVELPDGSMSWSIETIKTLRAAKLLGAVRLSR